MTNPVDRKAKDVMRQFIENMNDSEQMKIFSHQESSEKCKFKLKWNISLHVMYWQKLKKSEKDRDVGHNPWNLLCNVNRHNLFGKGYYLMTWIWGNIMI